MQHSTSELEAKSTPLARADSSELPMVAKQHPVKPSTSNELRHRPEVSLNAAQLVLAFWGCSGAFNKAVHASHHPIVKRSIAD
eukprot:3452433-Amphidinium_carterae.1